MLKRHWRIVFIITALVVDFTAIMLSGVSGFYLRLLLPNVPTLPTQIFFSVWSFFSGSFLFFALIFGLYRAAYHTNLHQQYRIAWKTYVYSVPTILSSFYVAQWFDFPRRFTFIFLLFVPFYFALGRFFLNRLNTMMRKKGFGLRKALIFGFEDMNVEVLHRLSEFPELGYEIKGVITKKKGSSDELIRFNGTKLATFSMTNLPWVVEREHIERIFVPSPNFLTNGASPLIDLCKLQQMKVKVLSPEADQLLHIARIHDIAGISLYSPPRTKVDLLKRLVKRIADIIGSVLLIALASPIFVLTSFAILIESGWPIIFKQKRSSSKQGRQFDFYKFRSMIKNADEMKGTLVPLNESSGLLFKLKDDPRMTKVGKFIRKYSIDELPQFFNVLKGDMSLVGPRPLPVEDFETMEIGSEFNEALKMRESVKPGITGLWQISGRSNLGFKEMILLDNYYIENQSILFDVEIAFATIPVVLFGKGAY